MSGHTYAKVWGLSEDENGQPDYGGLQVNLSNVKVESIAGLLLNKYPVEDITIISKEEFESEYGDN
ncbi:hypothetical protein LJB76_02440 [Clostridia bacterium OttesenSCG-928-O13]|nr:hypothetical protein [Clostridia bacterium OttesenSCG-928-O13]